MAATVNHEIFVAMLTGKYPAIAEDILECSHGLLHSEMGKLAQVVQAAISDQDTSTVRDHFQFIDEVYRHATPDLKNAIHVSYLERLSFDGKRGKRIRAREMLSPELQAALSELEAYNAALFTRNEQTGRASNQSQNRPNKKLKRSRPEVTRRRSSQRRRRA